MRIGVLLLLVVIFLTPAMTPAANTVTVTGQSVNLRAGPDPKKEVVCQVSRGEVLKAYETRGGWVQVAPPADSDLWVYSELVRDGLVAVPKLIVRAGPGINYSSVGHLADGTRVVVRGTHSGWLRIAPPSGCRLWISGKFVEDAAAKPAPKPRSPAPGPKPAPPKPRPKPAPELPRKPLRQVGSVPGPASTGGGARPPDTEPASRPAVDLPARYGIRRETLAATKEQGAGVEVEGQLRPAGRAVWRKPSKYRLVRHDNQGRALTLCYVAGDPPDLDPVLGRGVVIYGKQYWIQGVLYPVVVVERIKRKI
jgi:uncharacterized protein YraI